MDKNHNEWQSLVGILDKNFLNQVFIVIGAAFLEFDVSLDDFTANLDLIASEGCSAVDQLVEKNSKRPNVNLVVVGL